MPESDRQMYACTGLHCIIDIGCLFVPCLQTIGQMVMNDHDHERWIIKPHDLESQITTLPT